MYCHLYKCTALVTHRAFPYHERDGPRGSLPPTPDPLDRDVAVLARITAHQELRAQRIPDPARERTIDDDAIAPDELRRSLTTTLVRLDRVNAVLAAARPRPPDPS